MRYTKEWKKKIVEDAKKKTLREDIQRLVKWPSYRDMVEAWGECK